jgi:hypothetical protein
MPGGFCDGIRPSAHACCNGMSAASRRHKVPQDQFGVDPLLTRRETSQPIALTSHGYGEGPSDADALPWRNAKPKGVLTEVCLLRKSRTIGNGGAGNAGPVAPSARKAKCVYIDTLVRSVAGASLRRREASRASRLVISAFNVAMVEASTTPSTRIGLARRSDGPVRDRIANKGQT